MTTNFTSGYGSKSFTLNSTSNGTLDTVDNTTARFIPNTNNATITVNTCLKTIPTTTMQAYNTNINYLCDDTTGTINTNGDNSTEASSSICSSGWKLPSHADISEAASNWEAFRPVTGGLYYGGTLDYTEFGYWWSTNATGGTTRWSLRYNGSFLYTDYGSRYRGFYVRCVKE